MDQANRQRTVLLVTGCAAFAMMGAGMSLYGPSVLSYQALFSLTTEQASRVLLAHWIGSLSAVVAMFFLPGRVGPRPALFLVAAGAGLLGAGISWAVTLGGALALGLGYGALTAVFNPRILTAYGARGPAMLSLINAVFSLGAIAAPLAFSLASAHPERLFLLVGAITALILLGAGPASRTKAAAAVAGAGPFRLRPLILMFGFLGIGTEVALVGLGPSALVRSGEAQPFAAQLLSAFYLAFLAGRIGLVFAAHRLPPFALYLIAAGLTSAGLWGCALISPVWFYPLTGLPAGMFFQAYYVTGTALMGDNPRVSPLLIGVAMSGAMLMPMALVTTIEPFGPLGFFWVTAAGATALTAGAALAYPRMSRG